MNKKQGSLPDMSSAFEILYCICCIITALVCNCGRSGAVDGRSGDPLGGVGDEGV